MKREIVYVREIIVVIDLFEEQFAPRVTLEEAVGID